jgi:hypothetical protein
MIEKYKKDKNDANLFMNIVLKKMKKQIDINIL